MSPVEPLSEQFSGVQAGHCSSDSPSSITAAIASTAARLPHLPAILSDSEVISFSELQSRVLTLAHAFTSQGIGKGAGVGLQAPNGSGFIVGLLALLHCGAVVMPIPAGLTEDELRDLHAEIPVEALVKLGESKSQAPPFMAVLCSLPFEFSLLRLSAASAARRPFVPHVPNAALIRPTSGTTGKSKGVVFSHQSVLERLEATQQNLRLTPDDRIVWVLPMAYHFISSILLYLKAGAGIVIARDHLATSISGAASTHGGTILFGSPSIFASLADLPPEYPLPRFRLPLSTSGALAPHIAARFCARHGYLPRQIFGIIEVGLPLGQLDETSAPLGSLGYQLAPYDVKIVDDSGNENPAGSQGNLLVRGPGMFDAYLSPPQRREEIVLDGFFSTGDLAVRHPDGSFQIVGRKKSSINFAGVKVFPEEVENILNLFPAVLQSRVHGIEHAQLGEIVCCDIVLKAGAATTEGELRRYCRKHLSTQKIPQQFRFVTEIAMTGSGKIRRWREQ